MRKILVIGAGWYGCHIALSFKRLGFEVTIYEKNDEIFRGASGANQFRLHQGFHYARNHETRVQSRDGFDAFLETYPTLSREVDDNLYIVPKGDSLIDFKTYAAIMSASGIPYHVVDVDKCSLIGEGALATDERVILTTRAKEYFERELDQELILGTRADPIVFDNYDYVVDTTWGTRGEFAPADCFFEPTLLLNYQCADSAFGARTYVDGPLCSIYPTEDPEVYTLSSVPYTPLTEGELSVGACLETIAEFGVSRVQERRLHMEEQIQSYIPDFTDIFQFMSPQFSMKTKPYGADDSRSCRVTRQGKVFSVMSGKIDTIFHAFNVILNSIIRTKS